MGADERAALLDAQPCAVWGRKSSSAFAHCPCSQLETTTNDNLALARPVVSVPFTIVMSPPLKILFWFPLVCLFDFFFVLGFYFVLFVFVLCLFLVFFS